MKDIFGVLLIILGVESFLALASWFISMDDVSTPFSEAFGISNAALFVTVFAYFCVIKGLELIDF